MAKLIILVLFFFYNASAEEKSELVFQKILKNHGEIELIDLNNNTIKLSDYKKDLLIINFWATWCVPCREEMPSLNNLVESIASDNFSVIVIAAGRNSNETIKDFFLKYELTNLKSFKDTKGNFASKMNVLGLPTTLIVDQHSNVIARLVGGADWNSPDAINFINAILKHPN